MPGKTRTAYFKSGGLARNILDVLKLKRFLSDPVPFIRTENRPDLSPFPYLPQIPAVGVMAQPLIFPFKTAYDVNTTNVWTEGASGSGTGLTVQDARGGRAKFTNGGRDDDYYCYQSKYEVAKMESGRHLWVHGSIQIADVSEADWFWGLCARTTLNANELFGARVDAAGFYGVDGSADINCVGEKDSVSVGALAKGTLVDATETWLTMHFEGTNAIHFSINHKYVTTIRLKVPDDEELCLSFGCRNGTTAANSMQLSGFILLQDT